VFIQDVMDNRVLDIGSIFLQSRSELQKLVLSIVVITVGVGGGRSQLWNETFFRKVPQYLIEEVEIPTVH